MATTCFRWGRSTHQDRGAMTYRPAGPLPALVEASQAYPLCPAHRLMGKEHRWGLDRGSPNDRANPHSLALSPALGGHFRSRFPIAGERGANSMDSHPGWRSRVTAVTRSLTLGYIYVALTGLKTHGDEAFRHPLCSAEKIWDM